MKKAITISLLIGVFFVLLTALENRGTIWGKVTDSEAAALPGVRVTVLKSGGVSVVAHSDEQGEYRFNALSPGTYDLFFELEGFSTFVRKGITLTAGERLEVNVSMKLGALEESITILDHASIADVNSKAPYAFQLTPSGDFNTDEYQRRYENRFLDAKSNPQSTFSIDVDTASYANVRRYLKGGQLPPADAVRIEEMINYFTYDYPQPEGEHPFSVNMEMVPCPWSQDHKLVLIGLQGRRMVADKAPASNLVFLLDVSGSMDEPNKLPLLQSAFKLLTHGLRDKDRVAIVVYAGDAGLVLPSTSGGKQAAILDAIGNLRAGGCTAGGAGIQLAYRIAKENYISDGNNRVILATDGDFNVGTSSTSELVRLIEEKRESGIFLTVLGFGMGNYKDHRMEQLADKGNGNYYCIDSILEAKKVFLEQLLGTLFTIAKDVKIQVEFNPARVSAYRLIGYENRLLSKEDFNDDKKDAGELGAGHTVTALYEIIPASTGEKLASADDMRYQHVTITNDAQTTDEMMTIKLRYKPPQGNKSRSIISVLRDLPMTPERVSPNLRFAAAVAQFGMILSKSEFKGSASYEQVINLARGAKGDDHFGYRSEFLELAETARLLALAASGSGK